MGVFDDLTKDVEDGISGRNAGVPMGFSRLNNHISIRKSNNYLIGGYTGCLTGDTIVEIARKQMTANTKRYSLEELYLKFHGLAPKDKWDRRLPTRIKVYMPDKGQTSVHKIKDVVFSGRKEVYRVKTLEGKTLRATLDHRFMVTLDGSFKRLGLLRRGDTIVCKAPRESRKKGRALKNRPEMCGNFPYYYTARKKTVAGKEYERFYLYRASFDAHKNNLSLEDFLTEVRDNPDHSLILSDPKMIIHHIDGNPRNNNPRNLLMLDKKEHDRLHARTSNYGYSWVREETILSIDYVGEMNTYDVMCEDPYHNFIANGFVVHNSGKTSLLDDAFVLNPVDWYLKNYSQTDIRLKIIYWTMERRKNFKLMKWISRKIFLDTGQIIPVTRLMGWCPSDQRLTKDEHDLFLTYRDYTEALLEVIDIQDRPENPTGFRNYMKNYHLQHGTIEEIDEFHKVFVAKNPYLLTLKIRDHMGLAKGEKELRGKKEIIDKCSEDDRYDRDFYGTSCVNVSQFNRDIANPIRIKNGDVEPMLEDFKDTGNTQEDADVVLSLFDPMRYKVADPSGYDLNRLRDSSRRKKYRALRILKNSYGADDIRIGLAYQPEIGMFKEMPKLSETTPDVYDAILDNTYFLPEYR